MSLPCAEVEVEIVLAVTLLGCGQAWFVPFCPCKPGVCLEDEKQSEQPDNGSRSRCVHGSVCLVHWLRPKIHDPITAITRPRRMITTKTAAWITASRWKCRLILNLPSSSDTRSNAKVTGARLQAEDQRAMFPRVRVDHHVRRRYL